MPPPAAHKSLTPPQKDILRRWIASGAEYQPQLVVDRAAAAAAAGRQESGLGAEPHRRIRAGGARAARPSARAGGRPTHARPAIEPGPDGAAAAPAEVEQFVRDPSPAAYENLVDRLLASKQWGEHRARYWLDAARYADTHGIHFDNYREMWSYRDWVIEAFNRNLPFDRFTIEQLAGDLLPQPTLEQRVATGFNRCNITTNEGGAIGEEYLVLYTRDRTETTARVWLGLTAGCAVCHDHKFDPLTQKEFYQMSAFFNNTTQAAMDGNVKDTPPTVFVPAEADRGRWPALEKIWPMPAGSRRSERRSSAPTSTAAGRRGGPGPLRRRAQRVVRREAAGQPAVWRVDGPRGSLGSGARGRAIPRHGGLRDARAKRVRPGLCAVPRRVRPAPRAGRRRNAGPPAAHARRSAQEPPGLRPLAAAARAAADGPRNGQPLLAGSFRHGFGADRRGFRRQRRNAVASPNCWIGWRSSSASRAGT